MADQIKRSRRDSLPDGKLPGDVMVSILINLPVKSLLKFQAVSQSWYSLISSTHFFQLHLHRQSVVAPNNCLLSLRNLSDDESEDDLDRNDIEHLDLELGLLDLTHHYDYPYADDDVLMLENDMPPFHHSLLDSCNGLVCMGGRFKKSCEVILWNPSTRRYRSLDVPEGDKRYDVYLDFPTLGLCYVDDDFRILVWNDRNNTVDIPYLYVYSLSSDSWDKFEFYAPKTNIEFKSPTFLGSSMHWLSHTCPTGSKCTCGSATELVLFDVINRAKSCFRLPVSCGRHHLVMQQTLVIGGCISIVIYLDTDGDDVDALEYGIGIWVMEQYGVEDSWVKRFFIQEEEFERFKFPIVSWNDGEIVFIYESDDSNVVIFYDPYSGNRRYVEFSSYHVLKFFKHVESLAPVELVEDEVDSSDEEGDSNDSS